MGEFRMPSLGADMDVGTIVEWLVKPGDAVRRGQIVAVVDTAKAAIEIEAFEEGVVTEILVGTGVQVAVGTPLAMIGASSAAAVSLIPSTERTESMTQASEAAPTGHPRRRPTPSHPRATPPPHPRATPPVRHLAHQLGVDLDVIPGTGPDGHITHDDVLHASPSTQAPAAPAPAAPAARRPPIGPDSRPFRHLNPGSIRDRSARKRTSRWGSRWGNRWGWGAVAGHTAGPADRCRTGGRPGGPFRPRIGRRGGGR